MLPADSMLLCLNMNICPTLHFILLARTRQLPRATNHIQQYMQHLPSYGRKKTNKQTNKTLHTMNVSMLGVSQEAHQLYM